MPVTKSVVKKVRQNARRRVVNRARRTRLKTAVAKYTTAPDTDKKKLYPEVQSTVDKSLREGLIHKNKAARIKSRLSKKSK